jgi:PAS domain S-box-containing protein
LFLIQVLNGTYFRYLRCNVSYQKKTGILSKDIVNKTPFEIFGQETGNQLATRYNECIHAEHSISYEETLDLPVGRRIWATTLTPVFRNNQPVYIVGSREDITERKMAEQQQKTNLEQNEKILQLLRYGMKDEEDFLFRALKYALEFTRSQHGYLFLYNEEKQELRLHCIADQTASTCQVQQPQTLHHLNQNRSLGRGCAHRQPVMVQDYASAPKKKGIPQGHVPLHNFLSIPIFDQDRIVAVLGVANKPEDYSESDLMKLNLLMNNVWAMYERQRSEGQLQKEKELFRTILLSINDGILATDYIGRVILLNEVGQQLTGWSQTDALNKHFSDIFRIVNASTRKSYLDPVTRVMRTGETIGFENNTVLVAKNGTERYISHSTAPITDEKGTVTGAVIAFRDITSEREHQNVIEYMSYHDQLTGIYNRRYFEEVLQKTDTQENLPISIIMADVNGLKLTNDIFGHTAGDELLMKAAQIMKDHCREEDQVARIGGDEFVIILHKGLRNDR